MMGTSGSSTSPCAERTMLSTAINPQKFSSFVNRKYFQLKLNLSLPACILSVPVDSGVNAVKLTMSFSAFYTKLNTLAGKWEFDLMSRKSTSQDAYHSHHLMGFTNMHHTPLICASRLTICYHFQDTFQSPVTQCQK